MEYAGWCYCHNLFLLFCLKKKKQQFCLFSFQIGALLGGDLNNSNGGCPSPVRKWDLNCFPKCPSAFIHLSQIHASTSQDAERLHTLLLHVPACRLSLWRVYFIIHHVFPPAHLCVISHNLSPIWAPHIKLLVRFIQEQDTLCQRTLGKSSFTNKSGTRGA